MSFWAGLGEETRREAAAVALLAGAALGFLVLYAAAPGGAGGLARRLLMGLFGGAAVVWPGAAALGGLALLLGGRADAGRAVGALLGLVAAAGFLHLRVPLDRAFAVGWDGRAGGLVGAGVDWALGRSFGPWGEVVLLVALSLEALLLLTRVSLRRSLGRFFGGVARGVSDFVYVSEPEPAAAAEAPAAERPAAEPEPGPEPAVPAADAFAEPLPPRRGPEAMPQPEPPEPAPAAVEPPPPLMPEEPAPAPAPPRQRKPAVAAGQLTLPGPALYQYPPLELLRRRVRPRRQGTRDAQQRGKALEETLASFGVQAKLVDLSQGPTVTRFELLPGPGVKVSRISALADDLALALAATDVRIVAPIPGKSAVGVEVPNVEVTPVFLRDVLETPEFQDSPSKLTVALGEDIAGRPVVASLEKMLHVLIGGATGSGKSITLNALLVSLLCRARPDEVKLVLIDPKMVELSVYNGCPHLLAPVVTEPKRAAGTLRQLVKEMENRYALFTECGTRDIGRYNELAAEQGREPLPFIVVVIDELADLMLVARADVENSIQRLSQMARAAGIHLVVATQRPSVDVITGVIKANIPTRIALAVSSHVDSRTILDGAGAEKLVGRGDMLFHPMGASKAVRVQGAYIGESEIEAVLAYLRVQARPEYNEAIVEAEGGEDGGGDGEDGDALLADAVRVVAETGQASVSMLQRRLRVGFTRAGRLIDIMENRGFVGPHQGPKPREVLITMEGYRRLFGESPGRIADPE